MHRVKKKERGSQNSLYSKNELRSVLQIASLKMQSLSSMRMFTSRMEANKGKGDFL